jgi:hypothetical protein
MTPKNHFKIFLIVILFFSFLKGYAQLPDYIVTETDVVPGTIISGVTEATTYCKVKNIGPGYYNATDVLVIYAYINQDTTSSAGTAFGMKYIDEILMSGFSTSDIVFNNTVNLSAGDYYMVFDVQLRNDNEEVNDTNNRSFEPITILANITVEHNEYGTVTGLNTDGYSKGEIVQLHAEPNVGCEFINWTEGGIEISTSQDIEFATTTNRTLTANFKRKDFIVEVSSNPTDGGQNNSSATYPYGTVVTLEAIPETGYGFANWTRNDTIVSEDIEYSFTVVNSVNLVANFKKAYTISLSSDYGGTTSGSGVYLEGDTVTITAIPDGGYKFISWRNPDWTTYSTEAEYSFPATQDLNLTARFRNSFQIIVEKNDIYRGSIKMGDEYISEGYFPYNSVLQLTAEPNDGYMFQKWTDAYTDTVVSTENPFNLTIEADRYLIAYFVVQTYDITLEASTGGTVSGGGTYDINTYHTMVATPDEGYDFINWTREDGTVVSTNRYYSVYVTSDRTLKANFAIKTYTIDLESTTGGTASGNGTFDHGTSNTVTATPDEGYDFVNWTEGGTEVSTDASYTFTVTSARTLKANFSPIPYTITLKSTTGGTVSGGGTYDYGTSRTVTATPDEGYEFINWTEGGTEVSTNTSYTFTISTDRTLRANYAIKTYTIALESTTGGTVSGNGTYDHGTSHTVTATPESDYNFISWTEGGTEVSTDASYTFTVTSDRTLKANFDLKTYTVTIESTIGGTETGNGQYYLGTNATITATPDAGYDFVNWTEGGTEVSTDMSYTFTVNADRALRANYAIKTYTITLESTTGGTVSGNGTYDHGTSHTVTATPDAGYDFVNWTEGGTEVSTDASYTFTVNADRTLRANYAIKTYTIALESTTGGTVSGNGTYDHGTSHTVTATPDEGYDFVNWTEGGTEVSTDASYTFTISTDRTLKANYAIKTYTIALESTTGGTVSGGGTYDYGTSHTVTAIPDEGYDFVNWTENGVEISEDEDYTFQVINSMTLMANFELLISTLSVENNEPRKVYPNPVRDYVYVEIEKLIAAFDDVHAVLYDVSGKVYNIRKISITGNTIKFKIPNLKEGIYFINLTINSNNPIINKIVVVND